MSHQNDWGMSMTHESTDTGSNGLTALIDELLDEVVGGASDTVPPECAVLLSIDNAAGTNLAAIYQDCEPYG